MCCGGCPLVNARGQQVLMNSSRDGTPSQVVFSGGIRLASRLLRFKIAHGMCACFCVSVGLKRAWWCTGCVYYPCDMY